MSLSLAEFLHPLKGASQRDLMLAVIYYLKRYEGKETVTTTDIKAAFTKAKHSAGKKFQHAAILNQGAPYVHTPEAKVAGEKLQWSLTDTGEKHVREKLGLPDAEAEVEVDIGTLQALASKLKDENVRDYAEEAIKCLQVGALRASVVFLWTGAVAAMRDKIWAHGAAAIDAALKKHNPKARDFKKKEDFAYVKDADLLLVAQELTVIDKSEKTLLGQALDLRNQSGHPVKYKLNALTDQPYAA